METSSHIKGICWQHKRNLRQVSLHKPCYYPLKPPEGTCSRKKKKYSVNKPDCLCLTVPWAELIWQSPKLTWGNTSCLLCPFGNSIYTSGICCQDRSLQLKSTYLFSSYLFFLIWKKWCAFSQRCVLPIEETHLALQLTKRERRGQHVRVAVGCHLRGNPERCCTHVWSRNICHVRRRTLPGNGWSYLGPSCFFRSTVKMPLNVTWNLLELPLFPWRPDHLQPSCWRRCLLNGHQTFLFCFSWPWIQKNWMLYSLKVQAEKETINLCSSKFLKGKSDSKVVWSTLNLRVDRDLKFNIYGFLSREMVSMEHLIYEDH